MNEMEIFNELIKYNPGLLQKPIEELVPISFVGNAAVQAYRALVSKLADLPMTEKQKKKTLADGQDAGKMLLAIEARIGELLPNEEEAERIGRSLGGKVRHGQQGIRAYPAEITKHGARSARIIARHPRTVAEIIQEAEYNEDIPTKTAVLNRVRFEQERERRKKASVREKPEIIMSLEEESYLLKLERTISVCPKQSDIPRDWHEEPFKRACSMARIIYNRLEVLINETKSITG